MDGVSYPFSSHSEYIIINICCNTEILISQVVTIRLMTSQTVTINTYTIQLTKEELVLIDADNQQVVSSYPLECIKRLNFDEGKNELIICTGE